MCKKKIDIFLILKNIYDPLINIDTLIHIIQLHSTFKHAPLS